MRKGLSNKHKERVRKTHTHDRWRGRGVILAGRLFKTAVKKNRSHNAKRPKKKAPVAHNPHTYTHARTPWPTRSLPRSCEGKKEGEGGGRRAKRARFSIFEPALACAPPRPRTHKMTLTPSPLALPRPPSSRPRRPRRPSPRSPSPTTRRTRSFPSRNCRRWVSTPVRQGKGGGWMGGGTRGAGGAACLPAPIRAHRATDPPSFFVRRHQKGQGRRSPHRHVAADDDQAGKREEERKGGGGGEAAAAASPTAIQPPRSPPPSPPAPRRHQGPVRRQDRQDAGRRPPAGDRVLVDDGARGRERARARRAAHLDGGGGGGRDSGGWHRDGRRRGEGRGEGGGGGGR